MMALVTSSAMKRSSVTGVTTSPGSPGTPGSTGRIGGGEGGVLSPPVESPPGVCDGTRGCAVWTPERPDRP